MILTCTVEHDLGWIGVHDQLGASRAHGAGLGHHRAILVHHHNLGSLALVHSSGELRRAAGRCGESGFVGP